MAKLLQLLQRHSDVPFELVYLVMDPGYNAVNRQKIESNAALLHIPVTIFETNIFDVTSSTEQVTVLPLRAYAPRLSLQQGAASSAATRSPSATTSATWSRRPSWACSTARSCRPCRRSCAAAISRAWSSSAPCTASTRTTSSPGSATTSLEFIQCACRFTERAAAHGNDGSSSKRQEVKLLLRELRRHESRH